MSSERDLYEPLSLPTVSFVSFLFVWCINPKFFSISLWPTCDYTKVTMKDMGKTQQNIKLPAYIWKRRIGHYSGGIACFNTVWISRKWRLNACAGYGPNHSSLHQYTHIEKRGLESQVSNDVSSFATTFRCRKQLLCATRSFFIRAYRYIFNARMQQRLSMQSDKGQCLLRSVPIRLLWMYKEHVVVIYITVSWLGSMFYAITISAGQTLVQPGYSHVQLFDVLIISLL